MHHRRSIRLPHYDYSKAGAYYVTICTRNRACIFGDVVDGEMRLSEVGRIVDEVWHAIPDHFPRVVTDSFVVMPNHVHGVLVFKANVAEQGAVSSMDGDAPVDRAQHAAPSGVRSDVGVVAGSLGAVIRSFKAAVTKRLNERGGTLGGSVWQRNYHDRIVRDEAALNAIRRYIHDNPARWHLDRNNSIKRGQR